MIFKPLREYVLVRPLGVQAKKIGSIIVPGTAKQALLQGEVVACGTGYISDDHKRHFPLEVVVGDVILYSEWAGKEVYQNGERLLCMEEQDIQLKVIKEEAP